MKEVGIGKTQSRFGEDRGDLNRILDALKAANALVSTLQTSSLMTEYKPGGDPVTLADRAINQMLWQMLPNKEEGWLSEEVPDDPSRLTRRRVWVVDPVDGTKEFVAGIPEWCISVGLVEDKSAVAGGVCNPVTGEMMVGSVDFGFWQVGTQRRLVDPQEGRPLVLASRSEVQRGEWDRFREAPFTVRAVGSVAYKLALVAAGLADATWTLAPKHEWDVAAGVALVLSAGGSVMSLDRRQPSFNRVETRLDGLLAVSAGALKKYGKVFEEWALSDFR